MNTYWRINKMGTDDSYKKINCQDDEKIITTMLSRISLNEKIDDDETLDDDGYLNRANKDFSKLLNHYVKKIEYSFNKNKVRKAEYYELFKRVFITSYVIFVVSLALCLILYLIFKDAALFTLLIPPSVELLSVTIIIPKIIAQYLFNTDEEKNLSEIISNLQKYYADVRNNTRSKSK